MAITVNSRLTDLDGMPAFQAIRGSLIHGWEKEFRGERGRRTLADLQKEHPNGKRDRKTRRRTNFFIAGPPRRKF